MRRLVQFLTVSIFMFIATSAWADSAYHVVHCSQDESASDSDVEAMASEWLAAARTIKGGENLNLSLNFPVAASAGEVDVVMIMMAPSFGEWGTFTDNYSGSAAEAIDEKYEDSIDCGNGALWESVKVK